MVNYSFDRSLRLLDAKAYKAVFDSAQLKVSSRFLLFLARPNTLPCPRMGLVIAKKNVRLATQRNRTKRVIRESFRLHQHCLGSLDVVVLARKGVDQLDSSNLHKEINKLWLQLQKKAIKNLHQQPTTET